MDFQVRARADCSIQLFSVDMVFLSFQLKIHRHTTDWRSLIITGLKRINTDCGYRFNESNEIPNVFDVELFYWSSRTVIRTILAYGWENNFLARYAMCFMMDGKCTMWCYFSYILGSLRILWQYGRLNFMAIQISINFIFEESTRSFGNKFFKWMSLYTLRDWGIDNPLSS